MLAATVLDGLCPLPLNAEMYIRSWNLGVSVSTSLQTDSFRPFSPIFSAHGPCSLSSIPPSKQTACWFSECLAGKSLSPRTLSLRITSFGPVLVDDLSFPCHLGQAVHPFSLTFSTFHPWSLSRSPSRPVSSSATGESLDLHFCFFLLRATEFPKLVLNKPSQIHYVHPLLYFCCARHTRE